MKTLQPLAIAVVAAVTAIACSPKKDTANPDDAGVCTEEAKVCEDGSTVVREGADCEFPACPGEVEAAADGGDEPEDLDAEEADAEGADAEGADAEAPAEEAAAE